MKKEVYFTPENLEAVSSVMLSEVDVLSRRKQRAFNPESSALLVLDMQSYFIDSDSHAHVPSARAIIPGIQALMHAFASYNRPVIFTQHVNSHQDAGLMATWWRDLITEDHPKSSIIPELFLAGAIILKKSQYDGFYRTQLVELLQRYTVKQVVISGVMTHLCCETTARSAFMHGFEVFFLVDGTATYHKGFHQATLLNLSHGFATLVKVKDILEVLREGHA